VPTISHRVTIEMVGTLRFAHPTNAAFFVMPGLVPGIHVLGAACEKDVDGRDKPGHDVDRPSVVVESFTCSTRPRKNG